MLSEGKPAENIEKPVGNIKKRISRPRVEILRACLITNPGYSGKQTNKST